MRPLLLLLATISVALAQTPEIPSPAMVYGTFIPTGGKDLPSIATDAGGDIYTASANTVSICRELPSGESFCTIGDEIIVIRIDPGAPEPVYSTNLGEGRTALAAIAVSPDGHAFVTGQFGDTSDYIFPPGSTTGFVARLAPDGTVLYTTRFQADAVAIAIDAEGNAYITGTAWDDFETTPGAYKTSLGATTCPVGEEGRELTVCPDAFILKLDPEGNTLLATYLGGTDEDHGRGIGLDAAGNIYVSGETLSEDFPRTIGAAQTEFGGRGRTPDPLAWGDGFAVKFEPTLRRLQYATYLGGSSRDTVNDMAVDAAGNTLIAGSTQSLDLPVTPGVIQPEYRGDPEAEAFRDGDGLVIRLTPAGAFAYVTYFGGFESDWLSAVAFDNDSNAYIAGEGYVEQAGVRKPTPCDPRRHLTVLNAEGSSILATSYVGGSFNSWAPRISVVDGQRVSVVLQGGNGRDWRDTFATTPDAISSWGRMYVAGLDFGAEPPPALACVLNGASFRIGHWSARDYVISPIEVLTFFGSDLSGAELIIDGQPAPILYAGDSQINAVAPGRLEPERVPIELTRDGQLLATYEAKVVDAVPALFTSDASGGGNAAAWNQDRRPNNPEFPAKRGSIVELYATGFGQLAPTPPDGSTTPLAPPWPELTHRFDAWIQAPVESGAVGMEVLYAGPAPGLITGVIQINVRIPANATTGDKVLIQLIVDNRDRTQRDITLAIAP